jgi:hypothetical protein
MSYASMVIATSMHIKIISNKAAVSDSRLGPPAAEGALHA